MFFYPSRRSSDIEQGLMSRDKLSLYLLDVLIKFVILQIVSRSHWISFLLVSLFIRTAVMERRTDIR
jgi:hypothetical protein